MHKNIFAFLFFLILLFAIVIRIVPTLNNNFYFTMDQANDAVHVREFLYRHQILLRGPETGITGVYHGVLWYYFIAIGYFLFGGDPFGSIFMLILFSVMSTAFLMIVLERYVSKTASLTVGLFLQFYWWFYDVSRYGFNPFPLVGLSIFFITFLSLFKREKQFLYVVAAVPIGFVLNSEMAAFVAFGITYAIFTVQQLFKKQLQIKTILLAIFFLLTILLPRFISEVQTDFSQQKRLVREIKEPHGTFSQTNFSQMSVTFQRIITRRIIPQNEGLGILLFVIIFLIFVKTEKKNPFVRRFTYYTVILVFISYIWFSSNLGWKSWHTVYIRPLFFVVLILMGLSMKNKKIGVAVLGVIFVTQTLFFFSQYKDNLKPTPDPSILANEIEAVDWVYKNSQGQGFYVYSYIPSVLDYQYQYLFWWYGLKNYHYMPCEYSTFPNTPSLFVSGEKFYQGPQRECTNVRFLIVEPDEKEILRQKWLDQTTKGTKLLQSTEIGSIHVEMRQVDW